MNAKIAISLRAYREYFEAYEWYESEQQGLGDRFEKSLSSLFELIIINPLLFPNKKMYTREGKIEDFPYLVVDKVYPAKQSILITSILIHFYLFLIFIRLA